MKTKQKSKITKTGLIAAIVEYHNQGWSQQRISAHLGFSRSYIRRLLNESPGTQDQRLSPNPVFNECPTNTDDQDFPVPELERVMTAVQSECRKLVKLEKEEIRLQILEDLQLERRLYLNALLLLGASPATALNNAPQTRQVQQFITGLQQVSSVLHKNARALISLFGLEAEKNVDTDLFNNIDFLACARKAGLKETNMDSRKLSEQTSQ